MDAVVEVYVGGAGWVSFYKFAYFWAEEGVAGLVFDGGVSFGFYDDAGGLCVGEGASENLLGGGSR